MYTSHHPPFDTKVINSGGRPDQDLNLGPVTVKPAPHHHAKRSIPLDKVAQCWVNVAIILFTALYCHMLLHMYIRLEKISSRYAQTQINITMDHWYNTSTQGWPKITN